MKSRIIAITLLATLCLFAAGCTTLSCGPYCGRQEHNSSSLVQFLYPDSSTPPAATSVPQLRLPLHVGLAFLPSSGASPGTGLDAAHRQALLEEIRQRFLSRKFIADITVIPDYYLATNPGFTGLEGVQHLYNLDLIALVSYDQIAHADDNKLSLGYLTIVGAYVLKGTHHDVSTLVDLAVVHPATRSLVLRAGGVDTQHRNTTLVDAGREQREARAASFDAATAQMINNFDLALAQFETDVREGKANVHVTSSNGGAGSFDGLLLGILALGVAIRLLRGSGMQLARRCMLLAALGVAVATTACSWQESATAPESWRAAARSAEATRRATGFASTAVYRSTGVDAAEIQWRIDFSAPAGYHVLQSSSQLVDEWISIGTDTFRNTGTAWISSDLGESKLNRFLGAEKFWHLLAFAEPAAASAIDSGDAQTLLLEYHGELGPEFAPVFPTASVESALVRIWIDRQTNLLTKGEVTARDSANGNQLYMAQVFTAYGTDIRIEIPVSPQALKRPFP
jgi:rhombotail lipoprotein